VPSTIDLLAVSVKDPSIVVVWPAEHVERGSTSFDERFVPQISLAASEPETQLHFGRHVDSVLVADRFR